MALPVVAGLLERLGARFTPPVSLVGGAVRDLLLGGPVVDIDLAVEGPVREVVARLGGEGGGAGTRTWTHGRFGTATLVIAAVHVDVAATRRERYARPGALPDVEDAPIEEDLTRRDFTVNAIALRLTGERRGSLVAAPGALKDLESRRLRILHDHSFEDDPTRLLRLARYCARLGFEVEPRTLKLARSAVAAGALDTLSGPRIGNELRLIASEADPVTPWEMLQEWGIDEAIAPGFGLHDRGLAALALSLLPSDGSPELLVLALALAGVTPDRRPGLLDRLGFPARPRDAVLQVAARARAVAESLRDAERPSDIARAVQERAYRHSKDGTVELVAVAGGLGPEAQARLWLERLRHVELEIDGGDLQAEGIAQGPAIGRGLAAAWAAALDGQAGTRQEQLEVALRAAQSAG